MPDDVRYPVIPAQFPRLMRLVLHGPHPWLLRRWAPRQPARVAQRLLDDDGDGDGECGDGDAEPPVAQLVAE